MATRSMCFIVVVLALTAAAVQHAQTPQSRPQFRAGVEYVEVDARVVDAKGEPIPGLTRQDFTVVEDGVPQNVRTFSVVDIPLPSSPAGQRPVSFGVKPDVAMNVRASARGRTYLIVFDALQVAPQRTLVVRNVLRDFIQRSIGPDDLAAIISTGLDRSFENFTSDKSRLLSQVNSLMGQAGPSPTMATATDLDRRAQLADPAGNVGKGGTGIPSPPIQDATIEDPRQALRRLAQLVEMMSTAGEGSKAIILVSESTPIELTINTESFAGLSVLTDVQRLSETARRGNVPIYPVYPRGLTDGRDEAVEIPIVSGSDGPALSLLNEVRREQDHLRVIADDTGGVAILGNETSAGLERVVRLSSRYYVLGYNSSNGGGNGRYHRISITVNRPDARVLARKGYTSARTDVAAAGTLAGPPGSPVELRQALNAVLPMTDVRISATAAAFRRADRRGASAAVVIEALGSDLSWAQNGSLTAPIEMTAVALEARGKIRSGNHSRLQFTERTELSDRVRTLGFRWLARLDDLGPGRFQIRGAISNGASRQGSVWYDLEIPDFSKAPLTMSDVVLASTAASQRPTVRPDKLLAEVLPLPATSVRAFPVDDTLSLYAEVYDNVAAPHAVETTIVVTNDRGVETFREGATHGREELATSDGTIRLKARIPLAMFAPGTYTLAVEARQTANRAISAGRAIPFQVASGGNK